MKWLSRNNPFPTLVWIFLFLSFSTGYFVGSVVQSITIRQNDENTLKYFQGGR